MELRLQDMRKIGRFAAEVVSETLWPTRCALCDMPGAVLCSACARSLPYLDWWRSCRRCGAPFGNVQCDLCNLVSLGRIGREELPFSGCSSATIFTDTTGSLVRVYKDLGEQRLATELAQMMARAIPPEWQFDTVTYIPSTKAKHRMRGFDHAELLAQTLADEIGYECRATLLPPSTRDQRSLTAEQRIANLNRSMQTEHTFPEGRFLLIDDVFTTGSTLCAATDALLSAEAHSVYCLTFARV